MPMPSIPRCRFAALAAAALLPALPWSAAQAATTTSTFTVTANVQTTCFVQSNNLNFGAYTGPELDITTTLSALCSPGTPYSIGLNAGTSTGATVTSRKMTGPGSELLAYGLFQDSGHTINWGDTVGTDTKSGTGDGAIQSFTVYGKLPQAQFIGPGAYSDTITVTLTF